MAAKSSNTLREIANLTSNDCPHSEQSDRKNVLIFLRIGVKISNQSSKEDCFVRGAERLRRNQRCSHGEHDGRNHDPVPTFGKANIEVSANRLVTEL